MGFELELILLVGGEPVMAGDGIPGTDESLLVRRGLIIGLRCGLVIGVRRVV
jgi:hypothetical protein